MKLGALLLVILSTIGSAYSEDSFENKLEGSSVGDKPTQVAQESTPLTVEELSSSLKKNQRASLELPLSKTLAIGVLSELFSLAGTKVEFTRAVFNSGRKLTLDIPSSSLPTVIHEVLKIANFEAFPSRSDPNTVLIAEIGETDRKGYLFDFERYKAGLWLNQYNICVRQGQSHGVEQALFNLARYYTKQKEFENAFQCVSRIYSEEKSWPKKYRLIDLQEINQYLLSELKKDASKKFSELISKQQKLIASTNQLYVSSTTEENSSHQEREVYRSGLHEPKSSGIESLSKRDLNKEFADAKKVQQAKDDAYYNAIPNQNRRETEALQRAVEASRNALNGR